MTRAQRAGVGAAAIAFTWWGLLPLFLRPLGGVPALQITAWRYLMSCVCTLAVLGWRREIAATLQALRVPAVAWRLLASAVLLGVNWGLYVWAVGHGQVVNASLGYFINPLVNVLLGVAVLHERLGPRQWFAVALAALGVLCLGLSSGQVPWIALLLAGSFSCYGLLRKTVAVGALPGLAIETLLGAPAALALLVVAEARAANAFHHSAGIWTLLLLTGPVSAVPLALFAFSARRIEYSTVGMLQYCTPTLQFLCGVLVFREPLSTTKLACFTLIWAGLVVYASSHWRIRREPHLA
ncbi:MAG TPA: EamA family transporter RarD [Steroidobacteraceae bacterium]|nr:EamA family transporter RarD [Steroidobacteraceae bacterium]